MVTKNGKMSASIAKSEDEFWKFNFGNSNFSEPKQSVHESVLRPESEDKYNGITYLLENQADNIEQRLLNCAIGRHRPIWCAMKLYLP